MIPRRRDFRATAASEIIIREGRGGRIAAFDQVAKTIANERVPA